MLANRAKQLLARIGALDAQRQQKVNADKFRTRADMLSKPAQRLVNVVSLVQLFRGEGIPLVVNAERAVALHGHVRQLRTEYQLDRTRILKSDGELRYSFWESLKSVPDQVELEMKSAWIRYVDERMPSGRTELLNVLGKVPAFAPQVQVIRGGGAALQQLKQSSPDAASIARLEAVAAQMRNAWDQLQSDQISAEVLDFLRAVSNNKATLDQLTAAVRSWLEHNNLMTSFKVTM